MFLKTRWDIPKHWQGNENNLFPYRLNKWLSLKFQIDRHLNNTSSTSPPHFLLCHKLLASLALLNNTNLTGCPAFFFLFLAGASVDVGIDDKVKCEPLIYVVYHRQGCVIFACSHGKLFSLFTWVHIGIQDEIRIPSIKCTTLHFGDLFVQDLSLADYLLFLIYLLAFSFFTGDIVQCI